MIGTTKHLTGTDPAGDLLWDESQIQEFMAAAKKVYLILCDVLGALTKDKDKWKESIPYVTSLLAHESVKIQAKALWMIGEMGFAYPEAVYDAIPAIVSFLV